MAYLVLMLEKVCIVSLVGISGSDDINIKSRRLVLLFFGVYTCHVKITIESISSIFLGVNIIVGFHFHISFLHFLLIILYYISNLQKYHYHIQDYQSRIYTSCIINHILLYQKCQVL